MPSTNGVGANSAASAIPQVQFSCNQPKEGNPPNPTLVPADRTLVRKFFTDSLPLPDGSSVEVWGFEDPALPRVWPSRLTRATEGEVVHVELHPEKRVHTIHHHGIEPESINDGVGHTSFEISGHFTYQWKPATAGSYFYHCHVNTTLHVQMGMFGPLVIDPAPTPDPSLPAGQRRAFSNGPGQTGTPPVYEVETIWPFVAIDPRWHSFNHAAGLCSVADAAQVQLNDFRPRFVGLGDSLQPLDPNGFLPKGPFSGVPPSITAKRGQPILIRTLNSTYVPVVVVFRPSETGQVLHPVLIASDGRAFRDRNGAFNPQAVVAQTRGGDFTYPSGVHRPGTSGLPVFMVSSAERYDVLLNTEQAGCVIEQPGTYPVEIEFRQWRHPHPPITEKHISAPVYIARTTITIT